MKTIPRKDLTNIKMVCSNEKKVDLVIIDGRVMRWVGIGWVDEGVPTPGQKKRLPVAV